MSRLVIENPPAQHPKSCEIPRLKNKLDSVLNPALNPKSCEIPRPKSKLDSVLNPALNPKQVEIRRLKSKLDSVLSPAGLYFESGVVVNIPISLLSGWTEFFCQPYA